MFVDKSLNSWRLRAYVAQNTDILLRDLYAVTWHFILRCALFNKWH